MEIECWAEVKDSGDDHPYSSPLHLPFLPLYTFPKNVKEQHERNVSQSNSQAVSSRRPSVVRVAAVSNCRKLLSRSGMDPNHKQAQLLGFPTKRITDLNYPTPFLLASK